MRRGETAQSIAYAAEEQRQGKRPLDGKDDGLVNAAPDSILRLNGDDGF